MLLGTVVGHVWSSVKEDSLDGLRFLIVRPWTSDGGQTAETIVAADNLGAGVGERVLVVFGRAACHTIGRGHDIGFQTAVAAIVDGAELERGGSIGSVADDDVAPEPTTRTTPATNTTKSAND